MSCDDEVLNDVYMYWEPPVRRLPPLLFVRLKADLSQYLGKLSIVKRLIFGVSKFGDFKRLSALDKLLGQLGIYTTWLSSIAYLQKQLHIFIFFYATFFSVITPFHIA